MTARFGGRAQCSRPIDRDVLMDYWLAALPAGDEDAVEQHLMACDACGERLREVIVLAEGLHAVAQSGSLQVVISDRLLEQAAATGRRVREYAPARGEAIQCTVSDRLLAVGEGGDQRLLGEFTFHHTRTIPSPPGFQLP